MEVCRTPWAGSRRSRLGRGLEALLNATGESHENDNVAVAQPVAADDPEWQAHVDQRVQQERDRVQQEMEELKNPDKTLSISVL